MDKIKNVAQRLGIITVEDMERYTALELIMMIANKMNEFQETINEQNEEIQYLLNDGVLSEVEQLFNEWIQDGTFDTLINQSALKKVNDRIDETNTRLTDLKECVEYMEVLVNDYEDKAVDGDWSLAFNYVMNNVIKNGCGCVKFRGVLTTKQPIIVPNGINIEGVGLPASQIVPTSDFIGDYVIKNTDIRSHFEWKNVFINMSNAPHVGGLYIKNPYDYCTLDTIVINRSVLPAFTIGSADNLSQTLRMVNCLAYNDNTTSNPVAIFTHLQEACFINNKWLYKDMNANLATAVHCDGVITSSFVNCSFSNTKGRGLRLLSENCEKRIVGNYVSGCLFENCQGGYTIDLIGNTNTAYEGNANTFIGNHYMNSTAKIFVDKVTNTSIIDQAIPVYGDGARRTMSILPYDADNAKQPYGHAKLYADGDFFVGNFKSTRYVMDVGRSSTSEIKWNASESADYGIEVVKDGTKIVTLNYGNIENLSSGGGIVLRDANGNRYKVTISTSGELTTTPL